MVYINGKNNLRKIALKSIDETIFYPLKVKQDCDQ